MAVVLKKMPLILKKSTYRKGFLMLNFLVQNMSSLHTWGHVRQGSLLTNSLQSLQALNSWPRLSPLLASSISSSPTWQSLNCLINNFITVRWPNGDVLELVKLKLNVLQKWLDMAVCILKCERALKAFLDKGNSFVHAKMASLARIEIKEFNHWTIW